MLGYETLSILRIYAGQAARGAGLCLVVLEGHLDEEEQVVVPLIDRHLTEAEWDAVGKHGFAKFTPAQRWIATGQMVEVATPEETAMMFGKLPPPVKVLWQLIGKRKPSGVVRVATGVNDDLVTHAQARTMAASWCRLRPRRAQ